MRILTVTHYQPPHRGGIETVAAALVERYRRSGHDAAWLSSDVPAAPAPAGYVRVPAWNILEDRLGVPYPLWSPRAAATVRRWVQWCDVVHCHDCLYLGTVLALHAARRLHKPVLLTQHVALVPYRSRLLGGVQRLAYASLGRHVHQRADQVVFISRMVERWFLERVTYRRPPGFLANGVDLSLFHCGDALVRQAARARLRLPAAPRLLLFVGRFVDKKGMPVVERLARRLSDSTFVLIGEGPLDPRVWQLPNVIVRPFQTQTVLRDYYWAADLLLLPSTGEGFPLVVMEAMACGTPALVSDETFAAWSDRSDLFLISRPDADAVAAALERSPTLREPSARQAISAYARAHWDWDAVAEQYLHLLADLRAPQAPA